MTPTHLLDPDVKVDPAERKKLWCSLVKFVDHVEGKEAPGGNKDRDAALMESVRIDSGLSNISTILEMFGDSQKNSPDTLDKQGRTVSQEKMASSTLRVLRRFITSHPGAGGGTAGEGAIVSPTPSSGFQIHPRPVSTRSTLSGPRGGSLTPAAAVLGPNGDDCLGLPIESFKSKVKSAH